jgi:hypothetical protein
MWAYGSRSRATKWTRLALRCGLLLTDAELWDAISEDLRESAEQVGDRVRCAYTGTNRRPEPQIVVREKSDWGARATSLIGGIGIGLGLGLLLAPSSGEETRAVLRNRAIEFKNRVGGVATGASRFRAAASATGTDGD